jgi:hypothetical protein
MVEGNKQSPTFSPLLAPILPPEHRPLLLTTSMNSMMEPLRPQRPVGLSFLPIQFNFVKHLIVV